MIFVIAYLCAGLVPLAFIVMDDPMVFAVPWVIPIFILLWPIVIVKFIYYKIK